MDCTFPELLVRDLEASGAVLASKSVTVGRPSVVLAAPEDEDEVDLDELEIRRSSTPSCVGRSPPRRVRSLSLMVPGERHAPLGPYEHDGELRYPADISDSASDLSLSSGMEHPAVRTREQSFTTAATSVSGRCSSLVSQKPASPTSATSAKTNGNGDGDETQTREGSSWFNADGDVDTDSDSLPEPLTQGRSTPRPRRSRTAHAHKPRSRSAFSIAVFSTTDTMGDASSNPRAGTDLDAPSRGPQRHLQVTARPHTSNGPTPMGRPRLVDIQPPPAVPRRMSSLSTTRGRTSSLASANEASKMPSIGLRTGHAPGDDGDLDSDDDASLHSRLASPLPVIAISCGRTVIDATKPKSPSSGLATRDLAPRGNPAPITPRQTHVSRFRFRRDTEERKPRKPRFQAEMDGEMSTQSGHQEEGLRGLLSPVKQPRTPKFLVPVHYPGSQTHWAFDFEDPTCAASTTSSLSTPGLPLPPDVVETLRVQISGFPATMLLTSNLTVETVRAYSKKLRHRLGPSSALDLGGDTDNRSIFSFSSRTTPKKPSKFRSPSRWGFPFHLRRRNNDESPSKLGTKNKNPSATSSGLSPVGSKLPVTDWDPIRNIFPAAEDFLCDALYAHIVVYNYVSILCPLPVVVEAGDGGEGQRIPKKAAHLLGLQGGSTGPTGLRRVVSRRAVGGGSSAPTELLDVQKGLRLCIGKLVAELKLEAGAKREEGGPLHSKKEVPVDALVMRSLCEVVRSAEEAL